MGKLERCDTVELVPLASKVREIRGELPHDIADPTSVDVVWVDGYSERGVLGSFSWRRPKEVRLAASFRNVPEMVLPTFVHELRHAYQLRTMGRFLFTFARIPVIRARVLEPSAWACERAAEKAIGMEGLNTDEMPWF